MPPVTGAEQLEGYERRFRHAGLPLFSEDFSASEDVFNRAVPFLAFAFILGMVGATQVDWHWWQNALAIAGGLAILLVAFGVLNKMRGRSFGAIPRRVGKTELAGFVLIPALLPLMFGGHVGEAAATIAGNLILLGVVYVVVAYGLISIVRWVLGRFAGQVRSAFGLIANAVPLLAIFALLSFTTEELWVVFSSADDAIYALMIFLFVLLGTGFLMVRIPREARRLEEEVGGDSPPLRRRQLLNVGLVMFVSQALQVLIVSLTIGLFFTVFGTLAIDDTIREQWLGDPGDDLLSFNLFGEHLEVTEELLRVAGGLAAFSGFYFAISMLTDSTYRSEFLEELTSEMRESFRERAEYLRLRASLGPEAGP
jgi:hypothetical protein